MHNRIVNPSSREQTHVLLIDADDTLWSNNHYFEEAIAAFIDYLRHSSLTRDQVRAALDEIELSNLSTRGYGVHSFSENLCDCYRALVQRNATPAELAVVMQFGLRVLDQEVQLLDEVDETLRQLSDRHRLVLFTKGRAEEQQSKIDRSGISHHFERTVIVAEKDRHAYHRVVADLNAAPDRTWMVGNSPRSDINPALAAGIGAVYIPYELTWKLEQQEIDGQAERLLILTRFTELLDHF